MYYYFFLSFFTGDFYGAAQILTLSYSPTIRYIGNWSLKYLRLPGENILSTKTPEEFRRSQQPPPPFQPKRKKSPEK